MTTIQGDRVTLRGVMPEDLDTLYIWECDPSVWVASDNCMPYSLSELYQFIKSQTQNLEADGQLRLVICYEGVGIGLLDIFEYESKQNSAGVGILIDAAHRGEGYATDALKSVEPYLINRYGVQRLWCHISTTNSASLKLFKGCGYENIDIIKGRIYRNECRVEEFLLEKKI